MCLEKPIYRGRLPKKEGLGQFVDVRGGTWQERGKVDTPMSTMTWGCGTSRFRLMAL